MQEPPEDQVFNVKYFCENAYLDSVPIVALTGNVAVALQGRDSFQEVDIVGITRPAVKHSFAVKDVREPEFVLSEAFRIAASG